MLCNHLHLPFCFAALDWHRLTSFRGVRCCLCLPVCHLCLVINYASKDASETLYLCQCSLLVLKSGADAHGREASTPSIMSSK